MMTRMARIKVRTRAARMRMRTVSTRRSLLRSSSSNFS